MTVTLDLSPEVEARLLAESSAQGLPVSEVIKAYLSGHLPTVPRRNPTSAEIRKLLSEAAALIPAGVPPLSDEALSRESIYSHEQDWNR